MVLLEARSAGRCPICVGQDPERRGVKAMKVVIAGGSGLIGRALAADLVGDGHVVTVLSREPAAAMRVLPPAARSVGWDGRSSGDWFAEVDGADAVVNLAGANIGDGPWTARRRRVIRDSRVDAATAVTQAVAAARDRPPVVVHGSAVGVYGPRADEVVDESTEPGSGFQADVLLALEAAAVEARGLGLRVPLARSAPVLSLDGGALPRLVLPFRFFAGGRLGSGRQYFPWIHEHDEVAALRFLVERDGTDGVYNLSAPQPVTNAALARSIGRAMGRPAWLGVPALALRLAFGEMSSVLLEGQRVVPSRLLDAGFAFRYPDIDSALAQLLA
jgi:hypothetical protein